jgi:putative transcriptional regulator
VALESDPNQPSAKIAGSVVLSDSPGLALKRWRGRLRIKQVSLAEQMNIAPSVLSDYESGRRLSPGTTFVRKYVEALIDLDQRQNKLLERFFDTLDISAIIDIKEFKHEIKAKTLIESLKGRVLTRNDNQNANIYGYTVIDSIKAIYSLSGWNFYRIFGGTTERALVFTNVGQGRSPLVAIRVSQFKPRMVVLHGPSGVDKLATDLAQRDGIILVLSKLENGDEISKILSRI